MKEDPTFELGEALRSLPRHRAEEGFTEAVLDRVDRLDEGPDAPPDRRRARPAARWLAAAAGLAGLLLAAGAGLLPPGDAGDPAGSGAGAQGSARLEALAAERARLEEELQEIRRLAREGAGEPMGRGAPVLYLGGTEDVDLVLDLGRLADARPTRGTVPAGYRDDENW